MTDATVELEQNTENPKADVGSVFISNYPPFSVWNQDHVGALEETLHHQPEPGTPLGLYLHIPFCRKRCKFCYFKVYTGKNSKEIQSYLDSVKQEVKRLASLPAVSGRKLKFVYIGGGTPSYISARHMRDLVDLLREHLDWSEVEEFTFECEPGTLTEAKLEAIRDMGVTRLSLGVENFDDTILEVNGRAHLSMEVNRVRPWLHEIGYNQLNIDLISGMVGETWENWKENIRKTIEYGPDSVTIYQMELPYNTVYTKGILDGSSDLSFADWDTKRAWHDYAMNTLGENGFDISSAYTMVRRDRGVKFQYRDHLWHGADLLAVGVSAFGHLNGVHYQNEPSIMIYQDHVNNGRLPLKRAFAMTPDKLLIREMILQLKLGYIGSGYFKQKFGVDILERWSDVWKSYEDQELLNIEGEQIKLTRAGLLRVDSLLPGFYEPEFQNVRYT